MIEDEMICHLFCKNCNKEVEEFKDLYDDKMVFCPECKDLWIYK